MSEKQLSFDCAMMIVGEQKWIKFKDIVRLQEFIQYQQSTIEMYQRRVDKREEQISIIKRYCSEFLTDEQFEIIRKELDKTLRNGVGE